MRWPRHRRQLGRRAVARRLGGGIAGAGRDVGVIAGMVQQHLRRDPGFDGSGGVGCAGCRREGGAGARWSDGPVRVAGGERWCARQRVNVGGDIVGIGKNKAVVGGCVTDWIGVGGNEGMVDGGCVADWNCSGKACIEYVSSSLPAYVWMCWESMRRVRLELVACKVWVSWSTAASLASASAAPSASSGTTLAPLGGGPTLAVWAAAEMVRVRCGNTAIMRAALEGVQKEPLWDQKATGTNVRLFQQVLAAGAFGFEHERSEASPADIFTKALTWVKHTHAARLCSVELGDMPTEEE